MLRGTPASFFVMAAGVPLGVLLAWAELRLPALVVSEVTGGQTFLHAALAVGGLLALTFLAVGLRDFCKTILEAQESRYRFYLTSCLEEKSMAMFYQTYEKKQTRDMRKRAEEASYMMNGKVPLCQVPNLMTELIRNALCYALFGTILSRISPLLLVLLTLSPLALQRLPVLGLLLGLLLPLLLVLPSVLLWQCSLPSVSRSQLVLYLLLPSA